MRRNVLQALPFWLASLLTGLVAVLYTRLFAGAESLLYMLISWHWWVLFVTTPVFFFIAWWLVLRFAPFARGSGIPQVMAGIELATPKHNAVVRHLLSLKVAVIKILSSLLMVMGGGAVGREGPTIQIAGSIFRFVHNLVPSSWPVTPRRNMIITGAAAGLAAAFNTPLGGLVFAMEELAKNHLRFFRTALFSAVIIAGLTAQALLGPYLYLGYPKVDNPAWYVLLLVALIAIVTGIAGAILARIILRIMHWRKNFSVSAQIVFLITSAMIMATMGTLISHFALGSGKELMNAVLFGKAAEMHWYLPVLRVLGPVVSFTSGAAGGIFAPALSAGASMGALMANLLQLTGSNANILILAGMVGFLTGVTRSPFTCAILVLEMTDRHSVIFHLLLAGMAAGMVSLIIDQKSLYDHLKEDYIEAALLMEKQNEIPALTESESRQD